MQEGRRRRGRPRAGRPRGQRRPGGHHRGQDVGRAGHARAVDHARREPAHDPRFRGLPQGAGSHGGVRRRTLLRRLQGERRLRDGLRARGKRGGRRLHRPMRDERRRAASRGGGRRGRGRARAARPAAGHPLPQRFGLRCGELACRCARRRNSGAGHGERVRRTRGQYRPAHRHRRSRAEDGLYLRGRGAAARSDQRGAVRGRDVQPIGAEPPSLHGRVGVRAQGRPARQRHRALPRGLRAHASRGGGQHAAHAGQRAGRQGIAHREGEELGHRSGPAPRQDAGDPRRHQAPRSGGLLLRGGRRVACAAAAMASRRVPAALHVGELPRHRGRSRGHGSPG